MRLLFSIGFLLLLLLQIMQGQEFIPATGITLVAPRDSFVEDPFPALTEINCKWVAVVPYAFTPQNQSRVYFGNQHQWWGETPNGAEQTIILAKENKLNVMLKPQLWMHNSWVGDLFFETEAEWLQWEKDYHAYIIEFASIAEIHKVELFCIGTEFKKAVKAREAFWKNLIRDVRKVYSGKLTYCANWDEYDTVAFWRELDFIGISAYFPLSESKTPGIEELMQSWEPIRKKLGKFSRRMGKKIIFLEYGYLSVDGCAGKTWELEKRRMQIPANELAQSNAFEALYASFCDESFWAGGFLWKWYANGRVRQGFRDHDYTPQGKLSQSSISKWFAEMNQ